MRKFFVIAGVMVVLGLLIGFWAVPTLAEGPDDEPAQVDEETWEKMHEACEEGDWEAMAEAAEDMHGDIGEAPCHGDDIPATGNGTQDFSGRWGGMGGHMDGGMMGGYGGDGGSMMW